MSRSFRNVGKNQEQIEKVFRQKKQLMPGRRVGVHLACQRRAVCWSSINWRDDHFLAPSSIVSISSLCSFCTSLYSLRASQVVVVVNNPSANEGDIRDVGLIPRTCVPSREDPPGGGHGNVFLYSCLENPTDRGAWQATVHRVAKSWTLPKQLSMHVLFKFFFSFIEI